MSEHRFMEPLDVLFLRGNKLFGSPGSYGEALVPPWPSVAAGALRSQMMALAGVDFQAFRNGTEALPELGTLERPGPFRVTGFWLARRRGDSVETLHPLPADLIASTAADGGVAMKALTPTDAPLQGGVECSAPLPMLPALASDRQAKPGGDLWLNEKGWARYLAGGKPAPEDLVPSAQLWALDPRVGVGLDAHSRRASDGALFTVQAVVPVKSGHRFGAAASDDPCAVQLATYDVGFLAAVDGAEPPVSGVVRFGGDGRAAALSAVAYRPPEADADAIARAGRCRLVLTTPGLFPSGWRPPGVDAAGNFSLGGVSGRLRCAAVPRADVISGWDLARGQPKPAQRVAPAGAVYWLDELEASGDALRALAESGLWPAQDRDVHRWVEGFNRFSWAVWQ